MIHLGVSMLSGEFLNSIVLLGIAMFNALTAFIAWRTLQSSKRAEANIATVEVATNSMKDALVKAAGLQGFEEGVSAERALTGSAPPRPTKE
jgi:hypothetical protein